MDYRYKNRGDRGEDVKRMGEGMKKTEEVEESVGFCA